MATRYRLLDCPNCGKQLEDTKQDSITCKYCGHVFIREDVAQEDEELIRRKMIVDLRAEMENHKVRKKLSLVFMIVSFALIVPLVFASPFGLLVLTFILLFLIGGFALFILYILSDRGYETSKSKASDLSMRRRL